MKTCTTKIDLRPSIYLTTQLKKESKGTVKVLLIKRPVVHVFFYV